MKEADLALLLGDSLGVSQYDHTARLLHALARLVDAHDPIGLAVDAQGVVHLPLERVCPAPADGNLAGTDHGLAFHDPVVGHGDAAWLVAVDQEIGHLFEGNPGKDAGVHVGYVGKRG